MTRVTYDGEFRTEPLPCGRHTIHAALNQVVFFIRKDRLLPIAAEAAKVEQVDLEHVTLLGTGSRYEQYLDNGQTKDYGEDHIRILTK